MAGRKSDFTLSTKSLDDLFSTQEERDEAKLKKIFEIPIELIDDFPDHPFKVRDDEDMMQLVESIKERGIITPATVRQKEDGRYELISGHRRKRACELAGFETLRCEVVELNRDEATILKPRQYLLATREDRIKKVGGLYGLYLHYCYKLGYLPNYKKQNPVRLHYLLRDDLMKLDELTAQTTLLGKHHIGDTEQLFSYQQSVEAEIKSLTADRTHLRNEIRKVDITDERLSAAKDEITQISDKLKTLRKEVKLCKGIAERSGAIQQTLDKVIAEEDKSKGKEKNRHEQRR